MHDLQRPVGFTGTRQASAPAPGVRLELGRFDAVGRSREIIKRFLDQ
jgi:hypothetical protein